MSMEELFGDYAELARKRMEATIPRQKNDSLEDALQTRIEDAIDDFLADTVDNEVSLRRCWKILEKQALSVRSALYELAKSR